RGASVVKKRARTPSPMIATGRPSSTWSGVNHPPAASSRLVRRKYVVSTPTTFPERCRPSRVMVVLRTISALVTSTAGITRAIAAHGSASVGLVGQPHELEFRLIRRAREDDAVALREPLLDDDLIIVHRARDDFLLEHAPAGLLVHVRHAAVRAEGLERHVER